MFALHRLLPRSLIGRVFALYTATLLAFVGGGLGLFYRYEFASDLEDAQLRAETLVVVIAPTIADAAVIGDYDTIRRTLGNALHHSDFSAATFLDLKGGVVRATRRESPDVAPPGWLRDIVAGRLFDTNQPISVGGRDYGVLRLGFAADQIAGGLWRMARFSLGLAVLGLVAGLLLIRYPLVRWLGNLDRIRSFGADIDIRGLGTGQQLAADAPIEFRETFEALNRVAAGIQAQREQAAVTLAAIGDGVFTINVDGGIVLANPAAAGVVGRPAEALLGRPAWEVLPAVFADGHRLTPWRGRRSEIEAPGRGSCVVDTTLSTVFGPDGAPAGHVLACRDVTEQHRLDQRLREEMASRQSALVALRGVLENFMSESASVESGAGDDIAAISMLISTLVAATQARGEQLDAIFALSPDGFVSFDTDRRVNYVSPSFTRLTGLHEEEVLALAEREFAAALFSRCEHGKAPAFGFAELRRAGSSGSKAQRRWLVEIERPARRVLELGLREGHDEHIAQVVYLRDVTHETEVDRIKSEFLSTAAHELRTPMASIFGFSELMLSRPLSPERQKDVLETIHRQTALMISIVNELLDLARIEARGGKDFKLEVVDFRELLEGAVHDLKPPSGRDPPILWLAPQPAPVRVDRNKVAQALGNLLSNAYKYSPDGGPVRVRMVLDASERVGVEIRDEGIGMSPEQLARVGERFYRADASGSIPGTGLGVSIVGEIVTLLGGSLDWVSNPGTGTQATLWLPALRTPSRAPATEAVATA